jgi:hypothetical protein
MVALIDDQDLAIVSGYAWHAIKVGKTWYAATNPPGGRGPRGTKLLMHRLIYGAAPNVEIDHESMDGLDNRRQNLRVATHTEQMRHRGPQRGKRSRYKGVVWDRRAQRWRARIFVNGRYIARNLNTEREAAEAYNELARTHFGEFAWLNPLDEKEA